jgi:hypothetical protein
MVVIQILFSPTNWRPENFFAIGKGFILHRAQYESFLYKRPRSYHKLQRNHNWDLQTSPSVTAATQHAADWRQHGEKKPDHKIQAVAEA